MHMTASLQVAATVAEEALTVLYAWLILMAIVLYWLCAC